MSNYYVLDDFANRGTIVKADGRIQYEYVKGSGWVRSGILIDYFCDESLLYDSYRTIPEGEATKLIENMKHTVPKDIGRIKTR